MSQPTTFIDVEIYRGHGVEIKEFSVTHTCANLILVDLGPNTYLVIVKVERFLKSHTTV